MTCLQGPDTSWAVATAPGGAGGGRSSHKKVQPGNRAHTSVPFTFVYLPSCGFQPTVLGAREHAYLHTLTLWDTQCSDLPHAHPRL